MACAGERAPDAGDRANQRYDDLRARTQLNLRYETCVGGTPFGANCGLLLERAAEEDFRTSFVQKKCDGADPATCQERFDRALDQWLAERYYAADMHHVAKVCREHPGSCDSPDQYERLLLQSHNRFISSDTDRQAVDIRSDYQADRNRERIEEEHAQEAAAVAAMMATIAVTTHIHNHPSVFTQ